MKNPPCENWKRKKSQFKNFKVSWWDVARLFIEFFITFWIEESSPLEASLNLSSSQSSRVKIPVRVTFKHLRQKLKTYFIFPALCKHLATNSSSQTMLEAIYPLQTNESQDSENGSETRRMFINIHIRIILEGQLIRASIKKKRNSAKNVDETQSFST